MVRLSVKDTTKQEWIADVKYCLDHPYRMRAFNELTDSERPVIHRLVDEDEHQAFCDLLKEFDDSIPDWVIQEAAAVMGSVQLHTEINADMLKILEIPKTSHTKHCSSRSMVFPASHNLNPSRNRPPIPGLWSMARR